LECGGRGWEGEQNKHVNDEAAVVVVIVVVVVVV